MLNTSNKAKRRSLLVVLALLALAVTAVAMNFALTLTSISNYRVGAPALDLESTILIPEVAEGENYGYVEFTVTRSDSGPESLTNATLILPSGDKILYKETAGWGATQTSGAITPAMVGKDFGACSEAILRLHFAGPESTGNTSVKVSDGTNEFESNEYDVVNN